MVKPDNIIKALDLKPHPEGGYFRETYRSVGTISKAELGDNYSGDRNYSTAIYYLLLSENYSAFHCIVQDEGWHFYEGSALFLHMISPDGQYSRVTVGRDFEKGEVPQVVIPGGSWFAAEVSVDNSYTLLGCTVAPGFDFKDFELGSRENLTGRFPGLREIIVRLTRE